MTKESLDNSKAPILTHLLELRKRLLVCLAFFALAFIVSYLVSEQVYAFLMQPLVNAFDSQLMENRRMIFTGLHEAFLTYLKLSFFTALFFSLPLVLIQFWKFIAPGLYTHERASFAPLFYLTPVLFVAGSALAFYVVFPLAWSFFLSFENLVPSTGVSIELEARISEYLSLVIQLILAFGLSFELPILLFVLAKAGIVTASMLADYRRHAMVASFALAALITPPDLISQIALGTPLYLLYEISITLIRFFDADEVGCKRAAAQH